AAATARTTTATGRSIVRRPPATAFPARPTAGRAACARTWWRKRPTAPTARTTTTTAPPTAATRFPTAAATARSTPPVPSCETARWMPACAPRITPASERSPVPGAPPRAQLLERVVELKRVVVPAQHERPPIEARLLERLFHQRRLLLAVELAPP